MTNRREFLGAAAVAAGLVRADEHETPADEIDLDYWQLNHTREFRGVVYRPLNNGGIGWAESPYVHFERSGGDAQLGIEFRQEGEDPGEVTEIVFEGRIETEDFEVSTYMDVDKETARELAHIILEETDG